MCKRHLGVAHFAGAELVGMAQLCLTCEDPGLQAEAAWLSANLGALSGK